MFKKILESWLSDLKSLLLIGVVVALIVLLFNQWLEIRSLKGTIRDGYTEMEGKFEQFKEGVAKADQIDTWAGGLNKMLEDLPSSIGERIRITNENLLKIARFIAESDTFHGGGEVTPVDSNLAVFDDSVQTISCIGNPISVDRVEYLLKPFKYEGGYVLTDKEDYIWLKNLTLDQDIPITDYKVYDKRTFWHKWRFALGVYGDVDWNDKDVRGDIGPRIALGYNKWLIDVKKPAVRIDNESASVDITNLKSWKFGINRDFWWK